MAADPQLVPRDALTGVRVALSVSESADLPRLGLDPVHLELTIAELARAVVIAGGTVVYGGRIDHGFTRIVQEQSERYANTPVAFEHVVPYSEHAKRGTAELINYEASLGVRSAVYLLDSDAQLKRIADRADRHVAPDDIDAAAALSALRQTLADRCDTRVLVGGRLSDFGGVMPGVVEEAVLTLERRKPLYAAGGFGGAAAFTGRCLTPELYTWLPADLPAGEDVDLPGPARETLAQTAPADGLTAQERAALAQTNRPSDIATLTILGISRLRGATP